MKRVFGERRSAPRRSVSLNGLIAVDGARFPVECRIIEMSATGACIGADEQDLPPFFNLIDVVGALGYRVEVIWRRDHLMGVRFLRTHELIHEDGPRWLRAIREAHLARHARERADDLFSEIPDEHVA